MNPTTPLIEKKTVDKLFHIGMLIKAGVAIFEIGTGIFAIFLTTNEVLHVTQLLVEGKLAADPAQFFSKLYSRSWLQFYARTNKPVPLFISSWSWRCQYVSCYKFIKEENVGISAFPGYFRLIRRL